MALILSAIHRGASKKRGSHGRIDPRLPRWSSIKKHPRSFLYGSRVLAVAGDCRL